MVRRSGSRIACLSIAGRKATVRAARLELLRTMASSPGKSVRRRSGDRFDQLLDVADRQINDERSAAISMHAIGEAAGVSRALVYAYFADQYRLLDAVLERHLDWLRAAGIEEAARHGGALERLVACAVLYLHHVVAHGSALELVLRETDVARQLNGAVGRFRARLHRHLVRAVRAELSMTAHEAMVLILLLAVIPAESGRLANEGRMTSAEALELTARLVQASFDALRPYP